MKVLLVMAFWGLLTYLLALRKNRQAIVWGIFGALFPIITLLVLAFTPKREAV